MPTIATQLWVCTDCILVLANGNDGVSYMSESDAEAFWQRFSAGVEREAPSSGMGIVPGGSHDCDGAYRDGADCDCEVITFTRGSCDLCQTHLAGERHAATVLQP